MATEENKALARRFYAEIDAGNIDAMDELVAEDYVDHNPPPFPGLPAGREGLKQAFRIFWEATPGRHEIEDRSPRATRSPPGLPPTVATRAICPGRCRRPVRRSGRPRLPFTASLTAGSSRHWSDRDDLALMQQLGVVSLSGG